MVTFDLMTGKTKATYSACMKCMWGRVESDIMVKIKYVDPYEAKIRPENYNIVPPQAYTVQLTN